MLPRERSLSFRRRWVVVAAAVVLVLGYWVVGEYRTRAATEAAAEASASATARVGDDVEVCGLVEADVFESIVGWQIKSFAMSTVDGFYCQIYSYAPRLEEVMTILYDDRVSLVINDGGSWSSFEDVASRWDASPLVIDGLDGRGVTLRDDNGAPAVVWEYPDGRYASVRPSVMTGATDAEIDEEINVLVALFEQVGPALPETDEDPYVAFTVYPAER